MRITLGFTYRISRYGDVRRRTGGAALEAFRARIDALTCLQSGKSWEQVCEAVAAYVRGWSLYYGDSQDDTLRAVTQLCALPIACLCVGIVAHS